MNARRVIGSVFATGLLLFELGGGNAIADETLAFPEKFLFRFAYYYVRNADTDLTVLSKDNVGTGLSFVDDLGGEDDLTIPRIDAFYRVTDKHRIEFSTFRIERDGRELLTVDIDIGDESYSVGETVISSIDYELVKFGYAYSFYRSPQVELGFTLGINMTDYSFEYELADGSSDDKSDASGPLPMFGVRVGYAINSRWSLHYLTEVLFVEIGDAEGSLQNYELDLRYRLNNAIMLGVGVARFSIDVDLEDDDWDGKIADTHQGFLVSAAYFFE
ncbi:MAG: hypothetical protein EP300_05125 [Gammaproteobacteria bacterium]|nr:MAG: hypothetical protein EP300_05125 [Gammaproteobacteria bacterium]